MLWKRNRANCISSKFWWSIMLDNLLFLYLINKALIVYVIVYIWILLYPFPLKVIENYHYLANQNLKFNNFPNIQLSTLFRKLKRHMFLHKYTMDIFSFYVCIKLSQSHNQATENFQPNYVLKEHQFSN